MMESIYMYNSRQGLKHIDIARREIMQRTFCSLEKATHAISLSKHVDMESIHEMEQSLAAYRLHNFLLSCWSCTTITGRTMHPEILLTLL